MKIDVIREPELIFSNGARCLEPKIGLSLFGPHGSTGAASKEGIIIMAGAIGTRERIDQLRIFLERLRTRLSPGPKKVTWKFDYPGLCSKTHLNFDIRLHEDYIEYISVQEMKNIIEKASRKDRIEAACLIYERKFVNLVESNHPKPHIVFIPLSQDFIDATKDREYETENIILRRRTMKRDADYGDASVFNFHHFLKVLGFDKNTSVPSQIIKPRTLEFAEGTQDEATLAWNFVVATYYKATGIPWKLADLNENTCYVGISFYEEMEKERTNMRACMAHVYLKSGESQIIRGKPFNWAGEISRSPRLTSSQSETILSDVIDLFRSQKGFKPMRVVVHKSSPFSDDEVDGFNNACLGIEFVDLIHIHRSSHYRFYHQKTGYPPVRGTLIHNGDKSPALLYTMGFVPALGTYPGHSVPIPLMFSWARKDSSILAVASDIMALTKLDWNNSNFCVSEPVTISVSRKVGEILSESRARNKTPPTNYSFYM